MFSQMWSGAHYLPPQNPMAVAVIIPLGARGRAGLFVYHIAFDLWKQELLDVFTNRIEVEIQAWNTPVLLVHLFLNRPQWVGSSVMPYQMESFRGFWSNTTQLNYFAVGHFGRCLSYIRDWVETKMRCHLASARQRSGFGWKQGAGNGCMEHSDSSTSIGWSISRPPGPPARPDRPHNSCREACRNARCGKAARYV